MRGTVKQLGAIFLFSGFIIFGVLVTKSNLRLDSAKEMNQAVNDSEIIFFDRYQAVQSNLNDVINQLKKNSENNIPVAVKNASNILDIYQKVINLKMYERASQNSKKPLEVQIIDMVQLDLLEAYLTYVFEVEGLSKTARDIDAELNKEDVKILKTVAAINLVKNYSDVLRSRWIFTSLNQKVVGKSIKQTMQYRNTLVYPWNANFNAEERRDIAKATYIYFENLFIQDTVAWAKKVLERFPQSKSLSRVLASVNITNKSN